MATRNDNEECTNRPGDGLAALVHALRALGDAASAASAADGDVRLHVIACRAHHLASHLSHQGHLASAAAGEPEGSRDLDEAAQVLRREVVSLAGGRPGIRPALVQARGLVLLADAVRR